MNRQEGEAKRKFPIVGHASYVYTWSDLILPAAEPVGHDRVDLIELKLCENTGGEKKVQPRRLNH